MDSLTEEHSSTLTQAPLWTRLGGDRKIAGLDIHDLRCLRVEGKDADIEDLEQLIDRCSETGISLVTINPANDSGDCKCPYCAKGLFSYNPAHLSLNNVPGLDPENAEYQALAEERKRQRADEDSTLFNHKNIRDFKLKALRIGYKNIDAKAYRELDAWKKDCASGIWDYAVFSALSKKLGTSDWPSWPEKYKRKPPKEIYEEDADIRQEVDFILYTQWVSEKQWAKLNKYADSKGVNMAMDKPIYPQPDSADVWAHPELFYLWGDENPAEKDRPSVVSGVNIEGDPFGKQKWGHAVYRFQEKPQEVIDFFVETIRHMAKVSKVIRLDHALALVWKYCQIPARYGAEFGTYFPALKHKLLGKLRQEFPDVYFYTEDVGYTSEEEVDKPLRENGMPGMRAAILRATNPRYRDIGNYPRESVALTDNHDNEALTKWWDGLTTEEKTPFLIQMYGEGFSAEKLSQALNVPDFIRLVFRSKSLMAMTTLRTVAGDDRQYNKPGGDRETYWQLLSPKTLEEINWKILQAIIEETGRKAMRTVSDTREVLATNPSFGEVQRRKAGENLDFAVATTSCPKEIIVYTNIGGTWGTRTLTQENGGYSLTEYDDGIKICRITLPIDSKVAPGNYEFSSTVRFADGTEKYLTEHGKNFRLEVTQNS